MRSIFHVRKIARKQKPEYVLPEQLPDKAAGRIIYTNNFKSWLLPSSGSHCL
jgi:hypothetical protein